MGQIHSPNDPFFFMHHVQIDYLWRQWQAADPDKRLSDYYGNLGNADEYDGPFDATLNDDLRYFNLIPDIKVRDVMNSQGGTLCYKVSAQLENEISVLFTLLKYNDFYHPYSINQEGSYGYDFGNLFCGQMSGTAAPRKSIIGNQSM